MIEIELLDEVTPEVTSGMLLYGRATGELPHHDSGETVRRWQYWYRENPYGTGCFAVARDHDRVVGLHTFIPLEMRMAGRGILGGKGEFFVVEPEYRSTLDPESRQPLPLALVTKLRRRAWERGMQATFGVASRRASAFSRLTGAVPVESQWHNLVLRFKYDFRKHVPHATTANCLTALSAMPARIRQALGSLGEPREALHRVALVATFEKSYEVQLDVENQPLNSTPLALNFRFPAEHYLKYEVTRHDGRQEQFVFSRPRRNQPVRMLYWSSRSLEPAVLKAVLREVVRQSWTAGAMQLEMPLPVDALEGTDFLRRLGFEVKNGGSTVYVATPDCELAAARDAGPWRFTNSHRWLYQEF